MDKEDIERKTMEILHIKMVKNGGQSKRGYSSLTDQEKEQLRYLETKYYGEPNDYTLQLW